VERDGLEISKAPKIKMVEYVDKRTGEIKEVPEGIDPGFDVNFGKLGMLAGLI
jgi:hypothetical protein